MQQTHATDSKGSAPLVSSLSAFSLSSHGVSDSDFLLPPFHEGNVPICALSWVVCLTAVFPLPPPLHEVRCDESLM